MKERITYTILGNDYSIIQDSELVNKLFWVLGATLAEIQVFETGLIFLLSGIKSKKFASDMQACFRKDEAKTLGLLINELIIHFEDAEIKKLLTQIRDDRNLVVHQILRKYEWPVLSESGYHKLIDELLEIREFIHKSDPIIIEYIIQKKILDVISFEPIVTNV